MTRRDGNETGQAVYRFLGSCLLQLGSPCAFSNPRSDRRSTTPFAPSFLLLLSLPCPCCCCCLLLLLQRRCNKGPNVRVRQESGNWLEFNRIENVERVYKILRDYLGADVSSKCTCNNSISIRFPLPQALLGQGMNSH